MVWHVDVETRPGDGETWQEPFLFRTSSSLGVLLDAVSIEVSFASENKESGLLLSFVS